jgi:hypothetical protein
MKQHLLFLALAALLFSCKRSTVEALTGPEALHSRAVGASANELLSDTKYKSIKVEIQYMPGFAPDAGAVNHLQNFLGTRLNKPGGITIVTKEIASSSSAALSANDIVAIEKASRSVFSSGEEIALYILYTNGQYTSGTTLGVAYRNTSAAVFGKTVRDNSGGIGQTSRTKLEATVLAHEIGHLLGLVDLGSAMQTAHKAEGNHCNNQNCLMYYASETTDIAGFLLTGNIPSPDAACLADLRANGGK